jgi:CheY-like chemotaxis protein
MATTRILIADDHQHVRRSIRSLLEACPDWTVCGEAVDGKDAVVKTSELKPDIVLLDVTMPKMNGLDAARLLSEIQSRGSGVGIRGIRERLRQFRGQMTVDSNPSGTRVFVTIPIPQAAGN